MPNEQFFSYIMTSYIQWNDDVDDDVYLVLNLHAYLDLYSINLLKQQPSSLSSYSLKLDA